MIAVLARSDDGSYYFLYIVLFARNCKLVASFMKTFRLDAALTLVVGFAREPPF